MKKIVEESFNSLKSYCEDQNFSGWDPYDGLNSKIFQLTPLKHSYLARLAWIQFFKRSAINFRRLLLIPKEHNPKGLGLFLSGYCKLYKLMGDDHSLNIINLLSEKIIELTSKGYTGACWGYNFNWQARAFYYPKYMPTVVATSFVANAMIDAYEITGNNKIFEIARSSCDFILKDMNRTYDSKGNFAFSYSPDDETVIFNASLLGSLLLSRVFSYSAEINLIEEARRSVEYCCSFQRKDGSWLYGTLPYHQWVDSFHTGYNLESIAGYINYSGDNSYDQNLSKGVDYYLQTFFTEEGIPKYYNNCIYPIDIHAPAQLVLTLARTGNFWKHKDLIERVLTWTIKNMQSKEGYFFYQKKKYYTSRIPYIRWAQAWMFCALSEYQLQTRLGKNEN